MKKISALIATFILLQVTSWAQPGHLVKLFGGPAYAGVTPVEYAPDTLVKFSNVTCFHKDTAGNYFVADFGRTGFGYRIRKIEAATHQVYTIAGNGASGYTGDGGPAVLAALTNVTTMTTDHSGNLLIVDNGNLRKINLATNIITTLAPEGYFGINGLYVDDWDNIFYTSQFSMYKLPAGGGPRTVVLNTYGVNGFSGDGGPAAMAHMGKAGAITGDGHHNLFVIDSGNHKVRKIDAAGIITTIAGDGTDYYHGDGGPALSAGMRWTRAGAGMLKTDTAGNVYVACETPLFPYVIRKIDAAGRITKVAFTVTDSTGWVTSPETPGGYYAVEFQLASDGSVLVHDAYSVYKLTNMWAGITALDIRDTIVTPPCTMPVMKMAIHGTIAGTPAPGDSARVAIYYKTDSVHQVTLPYDRHIDGVTGDTTYTFGSTGYVIDSFAYNWPGIHYPFVTLSVLGGYEDAERLPAINAVSSCNNSYKLIQVSRVQDTILTPPCVFPAVMKRTLTGTIQSSFMTVQDTLYVKFDNDDSTMTVARLPIDISDYEIRPQDWPTEVDSTDTFYHYSYTYYHNYNPRPLDYSNPSVELSGPYYSGNLQLRVNSGLGDYYGGELWVPQMNPWIVSTDILWGALAVPACDTSIVQMDAIMHHLAGPCANPLPFNGRINISGTLQGGAARLSTIPIHVNFGDGSDTFIRINNIWTDGMGRFNYSVPEFRHLYLTAGTYFLYITLDTAVAVLDYNSTASAVTLTNDCSSASGTFFIDANHNCVADAGEIRLGSWPFIVVNNTTHDTTNYWCDQYGNYNVALSGTDNYTIISTHQNYYDGTSVYDSLTPTCPASGVYHVTAATGTSFTQNFGFECSGIGGAVDMNISGFGWGFVPGDTGVISIWGSNEWGYMCDTLASTVTLIKDSRLAYVGMWNGPSPSSVSGDTLTWHFSTAAGLLDFSANVKVACATTASMGDTLHNMLMITPTALSDPYLANNQYSWSEPVRTSWDPNEKEVSPKGYGAEGYIENGTALSYMVHFQNTGTARARHITVVDTLSASLDLSTLQLTNASAQVQLIQAGNNVIRFRFTDINLPDSASDPEGSKGYVSFNILPKDDLAAGTQIKNHAGIYFDYNPPVYTNETINTIEDELAPLEGPATVCTGGTITLSANIAGGIWHAANGHTSVTDGIVTGTTEGVDTVYYTVYGDKVAYMVIEVNNTADAGSIAGVDTVCEGSQLFLSATVSGGAWSSTNTGIISVSTSGMVTAAAPGSAAVHYIVSGTCGTDTATHGMYVIPVDECNSTGVAGISHPQIAIYPNPSSGTFVVDMQQPVSDATITITDISGKVLLVVHPQAGQQQVQVSLGNLASGTYMIKVEADGRQYRDKLVLW